MSNDTKLTHKRSINLFVFYILVNLVLLLGVFYIYKQLKWPVFENNNLIETDAFRKHFHHYMTNYNKQYSGEEYERRYKNFKETLKEIEARNKRLDDPADYGINKFSDMNEEEFKRTMLMDYFPFGDCSNAQSPCYRPSSNNNRDFNKRRTRDEKPPKRFNWRDKGYVGPVMDQGSCNGCWAFGIVGVMESMLRISGIEKENVLLSVQELIDCSANYTSRCYGGNPERSLQFLCNKNFAITTEKEYPLNLRNQSCLPHPDHGIIVTNYNVVCNMSAEAIKDTLFNHGPVVAAVNCLPWRHYIGGVIKFHCSGQTVQQLNHVVQIVGYDEEAPDPYFIARNTWGLDFGAEGYVKIAMEDFTCGIGRQISYFEVGRDGDL